MNLPNTELKGADLNEFLLKVQDYSLVSIQKHFEKYDAVSLYNNWIYLIRTIDEFINLPFEISDDKIKEQFLNLSFNLMNEQTLKNVMSVNSEIKKQFGDDVASRFLNFVKMNYASTMAYEKQGLNTFLPFKFDKVDSALIYYQSRRKYYVTILDLITTWAKGDFKFEYIHTLNEFQYTIDSCLQNITTNYYNILMNNCLKDYSIDFTQTPPKSSHQYENLESFLLEPQVLTMQDQLEFRIEKTDVQPLTQLASNKIFSYTEIENNIKLISGTFKKYNVDKTIVFIELSFLVSQLKQFCSDDFNIKIPKDYFIKYIQPYVKKVQLMPDSTNYFYASNFVSLFQLINNEYISSVVLFNRFITNNIHRNLSKNKSFQINSGFVFEDKVANYLKKKGFSLTGITRINRKEFDIITIKNNVIHNFQCKNNHIDISRIQNDPIIMARLNNRLIKYYQKAYKKEVDRENLILEKLKIGKIKHYVVSRYPIISEIEYIINYNELENWADKNCG